MTDRESMGGQRMPIKPGETRQFLDQRPADNFVPGKFWLTDEDLTVTITGGEVKFTWAGHDAGKVERAVTDEARHVLATIGPFLELFLQKNAKYAAVQKAGFPLGVQGVFPDINRKVGILYDRLWNSNHTPGEPTDEVIMDLIGHLFLMHYHITKEN